MMGRKFDRIKKSFPIHDVAGRAIKLPISPFLSLASVGFTAWKKYMNRNGVQVSFYTSSYFVKVL